MVPGSYSQKLEQTFTELKRNKLKKLRRLVAKRDGTKGLEK